MRIQTVADLKSMGTAGRASLYPDRLKITVGMATCGLASGADTIYETLNSASNSAG